MQYTYLAVDTTGKKQKGLAEASSEKELVAFLKARGFTALNISIARSTSSLIPFLKTVSTNDIAIFTRQLASMISTGLTLIEALQILKKQSTKPKFEVVVNDLITNISEGKTFSESLSYHSDVFSSVYISLIKAAEAGGILDKILERLADNLEKEEDLKRKIRGALFYPTLVIVGVIIVVIILNVVVIPQLSALYATFNDIELPFTTQLVLGMSQLFTKYFPVLIIGTIALIIAYIRFSKTETGIRTIDKVRVKIPVIGDIIVLSILDEITRTLSILITSGTTIIQSLAITANVSGNVWYQDAINASARFVEKGVPLSNAFQNQNIFPETLIQMVKVGESTGKIDESLLKVSEYFQRDLDAKIKNVTTALEPIIIIFLGVVIGFLIIAVITPIYGLIQQIK